MSNGNLNSDAIALAAEIDRLVEDVHSWWRWRNKAEYTFESAFAALYQTYAEFRSLVRYRFLREGQPVNVLPKLRMANDLYIVCPDIGGGCRIQHGHSTWIMAERIGKNFLVNQNVTIGVGKGGKPTIGDNVSIRTGAVVTGAISIGDNVTIAPTAFVNFDVPAGKKVFAPRAIVV